MTELQPPCLSKQDSLSLSGQSLIDLIKAVHEKGLPFRFRAEGFSMYPFLKSGDIITIAPHIKSHICRGDVVAFIHPVTGKPIVHRVIKTGRDFFRIRGDSALAEDCMIPVSNILGKVTRVERETENVYLGLGIEKYMIALLSEKSLLTGLICRLAGIKRALRNRINRSRT
jgi:signal peptidase I